LPLAGVPWEVGSSGAAAGLRVVEEIEQTLEVFLQGPCSGAFLRDV